MLTRCKVHRPNGPYLPVGDLGGEYCVRCRTAWPCPEMRCKAITYAGKPDHLLTRCSLEAGHDQANHVPSWSDEDKN